MQFSFPFIYVRVETFAIFLALELFQADDTEVEMKGPPNEKRKEKRMPEKKGSEIWLKGGWGVGETASGWKRVNSCRRRVRGVWADLSAIPVQILSQGRSTKSKRPRAKERGISSAEKRHRDRERERERERVRAPF